jgi:hypothetical protein
LSRRVWFASLGSLAIGGASGAVVLAALMAFATRTETLVILSSGVALGFAALAAAKPGFEGWGSHWKVPLSWRNRLPVPAYAGVFGAALAVGFATETASFSFVPMVLLCASSVTWDQAFAVGIAFGLTRTSSELAVVLWSEHVGTPPVAIWSRWWPRVQSLRGLEVGLLALAGAVAFTTR